MAFRFHHPFFFEIVFELGSLQVREVFYRTTFSLSTQRRKTRELVSSKYKRVGYYRFESLPLYHTPCLLFLLLRFFSSHFSPSRRSRRSLLPALHVQVGSDSSRNLSNCLPKRRRKNLSYQLSNVDALPFCIDSSKSKFSDTKPSSTVAILRPYRISKEERHKGGLMVPRTVFFSSLLMQ